MNNARLKIVVIGNSTALELIPNRKSREEGVFGEILERELSKMGLDVSVRIMAEHGTIITEGLKRIEKNVIQHFPGIVIINYGIVDCTPRLFPKFLVDFVKEPSPRMISNCTRVLLRKTVSFIGSIYLKVIKGAAWVSPSVFRRSLLMMVEKVQNETMADIILINIVPASAERDIQIKGLNDNILKYNAIIREITALKNTALIDICSLAKEIGIQKILPTDFHYNAKGHQVIAEEILKMLLAKFR